MIQISVQMADEDGRPVVSLEQRVTFELEGAGELLADLGTIEGARIVSTANGRAMIQIAGGDETTILCVVSDNLPMHRLNIF